MNLDMSQVKQANLVSEISWCLPCIARTPLALYLTFYELGVLLTMLYLHMGLVFPEGPTLFLGLHMLY